MAKTFVAPFTQSKNNGKAVVIAANSNYATPTGAILLHTAGAEGGVINRITARPRATVTATQLQLYSSKDNGATYHLIKTALMSAYTLAATTDILATDFGYSVDDPLGLVANERIYAASGVALAGGIAFVSEGEDF